MMNARTANMQALYATVITSMPVIKWNGLFRLDLVIPTSMAHSVTLHNTATGKPVSGWQ